MKNHHSNNFIRADIPEGVYAKIPSAIREQIEIIRVEPKDFDYSKDEKWVAAKYESTKAFKLLKKIEYEIRNP